VQCDGGGAEREQRRCASWQLWSSAVERQCIGDCNLVTDFGWCNFCGLDLKKKRLPRSEISCTEYLD